MNHLSLREQTDQQIAKTRAANPDFMGAVDELLAEAKSFQTGAEAIDLAQKAPDFELPNARGELVALSDLLACGPVVVTFYRGGWCPYCNLQLQAMQTRLPELRELGASLVAISPQKPDASLSDEEKQELSFSVLSDQDAKTAASYGVAWEVPERLLSHMRDDRGLDLESINDGNASILPIPATFVLDAEGVVRWRFVDVDYRTRAEPQDIVEAVQQLSENAG